MDLKVAFSGVWFFSGVVKKGWGKLKLKFRMRLEYALTVFFWGFR